MSRSIWTIRHGNRLDFVHPEWFLTAEKRYDPPLSEDGLLQAETLCNTLDNQTIDHIFVSPFLRAIQTAYPIAQRLNIPLKIEQGLGEWLNPDWMTETPQLHSQNYLKREYPLLDFSYVSLIIPHYPENEAQVIERTQKIGQLLAHHTTGNLLFVGHKISILGIIQGLTKSNINLDIGLCSITHLKQVEPKNRIHSSQWYIYDMNK